MRWVRWAVVVCVTGYTAQAYLEGDVLAVWMIVGAVGYLWGRYGEPGR